MTLEHFEPPTEPPKQPIAVKKGVRQGGHPRASKPDLRIVSNDNIAEPTRIGPRDENYHPREAFEPTKSPVRTVGVRYGNHPRDESEETLKEPEQPVEKKAKPSHLRRKFMGLAASAAIAVTGGEVIVPAGINAWNSVDNYIKTSLINTYNQDHPNATINPDQLEPTPANVITHVVEQQTAFPDTREAPQITKQEVENKYDIRLLSQHEADVLMGISDPTDTSIPDWTEPELHFIDQNLANTSPFMYAEYDGRQLSISIGSLSNIPSTEIAGSTTCSDKCGGNFNYRLDLINISRSLYDSNLTIIQKQGLVDHELGHRVDGKTSRSTKPDFQAILGDMSYMQLDAFSAHPLVTYSSDELAVIDVLKSFAGGESNPNSPHQIFVEGVAQSCGLFAQWDYPTFVKNFGEFLDGEIRPDGSYNDAYVYYLENSPVPDSVLQEIFPKADALYRLIQTKFFGGYGYNSNHQLIKEADAIPAQTEIPIPTQPPIDPNENDGGGALSQPSFPPGTAVLDGQAIGTIGGPAGNRQVTSIKPPSSKAV